jgi:hypothetical protein
MDDDNSLADGCQVDGAGDSAFALHAQLPKRPLKMFHIGFANSFKAMGLNQFNNALEAGSKIGGALISASFTCSLKNSTSHTICSYYTFFAMFALRVYAMCAMPPTFPGAGSVLVQEDKYIVQVCLCGI